MKMTSGLAWLLLGRGHDASSNGHVNGFQLCPCVKLFSLPFSVLSFSQAMCPAIYVILRLQKTIFQKLEFLLFWNLANIHFVPQKKATHKTISLMYRKSVRNCVKRWELRLQSAPKYTFRRLQRWKFCKKFRKCLTLENSIDPDVEIWTIMVMPDVKML